MNLDGEFDVYCEWCGSTGGQEWHDTMLEMDLVKVKESEERRASWDEFRKSSLLCTDCVGIGNEVKRIGELINKLANQLNAAFKVIGDRREVGTRKKRRLM